MIPTLYRLVSVEQAKANMRILHSFEDATLDELVIQASHAVMDYVGADSLALDGWCDTNGLPLVDADGNPQRIGAEVDSNGDLVLDSAGDPVDDGISIIPGPVQRATLVTIANWYDDAEGLRDGLPVAAQSLLVRFRDPPVA